MHEFGLMQSVLESVENAAIEAGASYVSRITLSIGEMTEVVQDALDFAFEALAEGTRSERAQLVVNMIRPRSLCAECGNEFEHDRYHWACPQCDSLATQLLAGKELYIDSIEVDVSKDED